MRELYTAQAHWVHVFIEFGKETEYNMKFVDTFLIIANNVLICCCFFVNNVLIFVILILRQGFLTFRDCILSLFTVCRFNLSF